MPPRRSQDTSLLGVILIAKTHTGGPRIVFHYPHTPNHPSSALFSHSSSAAAGWFGGASSSTEEGAGSSEDGWSEGDGESEGVAEMGEGGSKSGRGAGSMTTTGLGGRSGGVKGLGVWAREMEDDEDEVGAGMGLGMGSASYDLGREAMGNSVKGAGKSGELQMQSEAEWERVLGFKTESLEKLLSPQPAFHKRKFEVGLDGCFFVGAPMFVREDGFWKKRRKRGEKKVKKRQESIVLPYPGDIFEEGPNDELRDDEDYDEAIDMADPPPLPPLVLPSGFEAGYGHSMSTATSDAGSDAKDPHTGQKKNDMIMFNVVFVMNPPALEYQAKVREMYDNVIRKFAKTLKGEQARSNYVWSESKRILAMKAKAKEDRVPIRTLWNNIISASPMARSIKVIYDSISNSDIAHIHLNADCETSFQIPQASFTSYVPTTTEPQIPGLWLTTSPVMDEDDAEFSMAQHCALLLLADPETLIKEIEGSDTRDHHSSPLAFYIRAIIPTKSLHKLSLAHSISPSDMETIARHLVYWRRARLIPPLHPRDTYIVSPNADLSALPAAIPAYAARFPTLPSLPQMLSKLSLAPKPYASLIPTNDHRAMYMEILAWLMRGGWVTQLRTFAWIRVTPAIKARVQAQLEEDERKAEEAARAEERLAEEARQRSSSLQDLRGLLTSPVGRRSHTNVRSVLEGEGLGSSRPATTGRGVAVAVGRPSSTGTEGSERSERERERHATLHPHPHPHPHKPPLSSASPTSPRPAPLNPKRPSPLHTHDPLTPSLPRSPPIAPNPSPSPAFTPLPASPPASTSLASAPSSPLPSTSNSNAHSHPNGFPPSPTKVNPLHTPSLILSPLRATSLEAAYLSAIRATLEPADTRALWPTLLKYFDGRRALEDVSVREGLKRKRVVAALGEVRRGGWVVEVRHW